MKQNSPWGGAGIAVALGALAALSPVPSRASAKPTPSTVIDWFTNARSVTAGQVPWAAVTELAMVQGAVYDAVNAIDRTHQPYLVSPPARSWYSRDAAAATAAYRVLLNLRPARQATLQSKYAQSLAAIPGGPAKKGGIGVGVKAAAAMIAARRNDGRHADLHYVIGTRPGQWRPTPGDRVDNAAWVSKVRPFLIPDVGKFRARPPRPLSGKEYAKDFNETKSTGGRASITRTSDQTQAAWFWDTAGWIDVATSLAKSRPLTAADTARLFAVHTLAVADATIVCLDGKYRWSGWRPITAIRQADRDGNPATSADPNWSPLLVPQAGNPEHPSGHACGSTAAAKSLAFFFGTDGIAFSLRNRTYGTTRSFTGFTAAQQEVLKSRVWGGVHFPYAGEIGAEVGGNVAGYMAGHYFRRRPAAQG